MFPRQRIHVRGADRPCGRGALRGQEPRPEPGLRSLSAPEAFRAGFCAIAGLPNVGKSTLLNRLVRHELSIVTPKAQTTRQRLLGIYTDDAHQAVFVDTPGLVEPRYLLQERMRSDAERAIREADVLLYVADAGYPPSIEHAAKFPRPNRDSPLCLNKVDRVSPALRAEMEARLVAAGWGTVVSTIATQGQGVERLKEEVLRRLPPSPPLYPADDLAVAPVRYFVAEIVRAAVFELLEAEVPYATAVTIEEFLEPPRPGAAVYIRATIHVERPSQKGIVIGSSGRMIRQIGATARPRIEALTGERVYLELRVKVLRNWRRREGALKLLGFRSSA